MLVVPRLSWPVLFGENHLHSTQALVDHGDPSILFRHPSMSQISTDLLGLATHHSILLLQEPGEKCQWMLHQNAMNGPECALATTYYESRAIQPTGEYD